MLWNGEGRAVSVATELISPLLGCQRNDGGGCRPHSGTTGDLDGDGVHDLRTSCAYDGGAQILYGPLGAGALDMAVDADLFIEGVQEKVVAGEFTGDLNRDFVTERRGDSNLLFDGGI